MSSNKIDGKDILTWRMSEDPQFQQKFLQDKNFAKEEFNKAGINLTDEHYQKLHSAFSQLESVTKNVFGNDFKLRFVAIKATSI